MKTHLPYGNALKTALLLLLFFLAPANVWGQEKKQLAGDPPAHVETPAEPENDPRPEVPADAARARTDAAESEDAASPWERLKTTYPGVDSKELIRAFFVNLSINPQAQAFLQDNTAADKLGLTGNEKGYFQAIQAADQKSTADLLKAFRDGKGKMDNVERTILDLRMLKDEIFAAVYTVTLHQKEKVFELVTNLRAKTDKQAAAQDAAVILSMIGSEKRAEFLAALKEVQATDPETLRTRDALDFAAKIQQAVKGKDEDKDLAAVNKLESHAYLAGLKPEDKAALLKDAKSFRTNEIERSREYEELTSLARSGGNGATEARRKLDEKYGSQQANFSAGRATLFDIKAEMEKDQQAAKERDRYIEDFKSAAHVGKGPATFVGAVQNTERIETLDAADQESMRNYVRHVAEYSGLYDFGKGSEKAAEHYHLLKDNKFIVADAESQLSSDLEKVAFRLSVARGWVAASDSEGKFGWKRWGADPDFKFDSNSQPLPDVASQQVAENAEPGQVTGNSGTNESAAQTSEQGEAAGYENPAAESFNPWVPDRPNQAGSFFDALNRNDKQSGTGDTPITVELAPDVAAPDKPSPPGPRGTTHTAQKPASPPEAVSTRSQEDKIFKEDPKFLSADAQVRSIEEAIKARTLTTNKSLYSFGGIWDRWNNGLANNVYYPIAKWVYGVSGGRTLEQDLADAKANLEVEKKRIRIQDLRLASDPAAQ